MSVSDLMHGAMVTSASPMFTLPMKFSVKSGFGHPSARNFSAAALVEATSGWSNGQRFIR